MATEADCASSAGASTAGAAPSVGVVAGAASVGAGAAGAVSGNDTGAPTLSLTTGAFANGSFGFDDVFEACGATCVCVSATTGTRCTTLFAGRGATDGTRCAECSDCATRGSGARRCTFGTRKSGSGAFGSDNVGNDNVRADIAGCLNAPAIGSA